MKNRIKSSDRHKLTTNIRDIWRSVVADPCFKILKTYPCQRKFSQPDHKQSRRKFISCKHVLLEEVHFLTICPTADSFKKTVLRNDKRMWNYLLTKTITVEFHWSWLCFPITQTPEQKHSIFRLDT